MQLHFSKIGKRRVFVYKTFACILFLLIKRFGLKETIIIDTEYPGNMALIKSYLYGVQRKYSLGEEGVDIRFGFVGKKSNAHKTAISAFRLKKYGKKNLATAGEILEILSGI